MLHPRGPVALVGWPPGSFEQPIFDVALRAKAGRGSIVGTRKNLQELLEFAGEGKVAAHHSMDKLDNINAIVGRMKAGGIDGRIVVSIRIPRQQPGARGLAFSPQR